ncbi:MAG: OmpA family protein [Bacteroidota bacterium]
MCKFDGVPFVFFLLLCLFPLKIFTQHIANPAFAPFQGEVFKIPARAKISGYHENIRNFEKAGKITLEKINVPEVNYKMPFPQLEFMHRFAIVFTSEMIVAEKAVYVFSLNSDDGSRFWIGNNEVINNDGTHQMRFKSDTVLLDKGTYPVKLWFFQGFPDRYGLEFNAVFYKKYNLAEEKEYALVSAVPKLVFNNTNLPFASNSFYLEKRGQAVIDSLAVQLNKVYVNQIIINGHTDNIGSDVYNRALSLRRAETIKRELKKRLKNKKIKFELNGFGESEPIEKNGTVEGRSKNRRVEIIIN